MSGQDTHSPRIPAGGNTEPAAAEPRNRRGGQVMETLSRLGPLLGLIVVWCLFAALKKDSFTSLANHQIMLLQTAVVGTAAVGATLVIISGGIDLSVGSMIAFGVMVLAVLLKAGCPPLVAAAGSVAAGCCVGWAIGAMVVGHVGRVGALAGAVFLGYRIWAAELGLLLAIVLGLAVLAGLWFINERFIRRIPLSPFIVTLGAWSVLRGAAKGLGDNQIIHLDPTWLNQLMSTTSNGLFSLFAPGVWIMIGMALTMAFVLRYTRFGRYIFAVGSNEQTARLCGIDVSRTKMMIYAVAVSCAGLAAILQFAYLGGVGDCTTAEGYELKVIAAVVIGGASLSGGEGSILGTLVGAMLMTVIDNGCGALGLDNWVQEIVTGTIIVAAAGLDQLRHRRMAAGGE